MKKLLLFSCVLFSGLQSKAQSAYTLTSGNWTNPLIWSCTCVPVNNYSVTINHTVTLNTDMVISGGMNIAFGGSVIQDAGGNRSLLLNGQSFYSNGSINVKNLMFSSGNGSGYSDGTITTTAFASLVPFQNYGTLTTDSIYIENQFDNSAILNADSLTNRGHLSNFRIMNVAWMTNDSLMSNYDQHYGYTMTNNGRYYNHDSLVLQNSMWNAARFTNDFDGKIVLHNNFFNYNPAHTASFDNRGGFECDSWYNTDTVKGAITGIFTVADTSENAGIMKGYFKFCDLTPPANAPFVDLNGGSIGPDITWCAGIGLETADHINSISVFPNPTATRFTVKGNQVTPFTISDELGRVVYSNTLDAGNDYRIEIPQMQNGIYFLLSTDGMIRKKIVVTK